MTLSDTQAGLNDIYDIVAKFLALVDEIHIDGTNGVGVFVVVHVSDVLRLQLVAVVVDLMLDIKRTIDIERLLATLHQAVHLRERLIREFHHLMDMIILLLDEVILLAVIFP